MQLPLNQIPAAWAFSRSFVHTMTPVHIKPGSACSIITLSTICAMLQPAHIHSQQRILKAVADIYRVREYA